MPFFLQQPIRASNGKTTQIIFGTLPYLARDKHIGTDLGSGNPRQFDLKIGT